MRHYYSDNRYFHQLENYSRVQHHNIDPYNGGDIQRLTPTPVENTPINTSPASTPRTRSGSSVNVVFVLFHTVGLLLDLYTNIITQWNHLTFTAGEVPKNDNETIH